MTAVVLALLAVTVAFCLAVAHRERRNMVDARLARRLARARWRDDYGLADWLNGQERL